MQDRPTLRQIADDLKISVSTVSLVLNNRPGVGSDRRRVIQEHLREVGYTRGSRGRPVTEHTETLAFVVYDARDIEASHNPFFSEIQRAIEQEAAIAGAALHVLYISEGDDLADVARRLRGMEIGGAVVDASVMPLSALQALTAHGLPVVALDTCYPDAAVDSVAIDNGQGTRSAIAHLVGHGHRRIGLVTTSVPSRNFEERENAFVDALEDHAVDPTKALVLRVPPTLQGAWQGCAAQLPRELSKLPTAFFAANDIIASGLLRILAERKIVVPDKVSVVGFDDIPLGELLHPPLTTVRVFKRRMAAVAVRRLIDRIHDRPPESISVRVSTELIVRNSSGSVAAG